LLVGVISNEVPLVAQVNLSWTATPGATGYIVRRATVNGGFAVAE